MTPADAIVADGSGGFNVLGSHSYSSAQRFAVIVTIDDQGTSYVLATPTGPVAVSTPGGATARADSTAVVSDTGLPFAATGLPVAATEGFPFLGAVATFTTDLPRRSRPPSRRRSTGATAHRRPWARSPSPWVPARC